MSSVNKKYIFAAVFVLAGIIFFVVNGKLARVTAPPIVDASPAPTFVPARIPKTIPIAEGTLKKLVIAAGDYLVRQQLPNGELSYQVDFMSGERTYSPSHMRLMAGTGSLFTVCRVAANLKYCNAGDLALEHYLELLVSDPANFRGTCFYKPATN